MGEKYKGLNCKPLEENPNLYVCEVEGTKEKMICELIETEHEVKLSCPKKPTKVLV